MLREMGGETELVDKSMLMVTPSRVASRLEDAAMISLLKTLVTKAFPATQTLESESSVSICRKRRLVRKWMLDH
jgi:hypothetical protein